MIDRFSSYDAAMIRKSLERRWGKLDPAMVKSLTCDQDKETAQHERKLRGDPELNNRQSHPRHNKKDGVQLPAHLCAVLQPRQSEPIWEYSSAKAHQHAHFAS